MAGRGKVGAVMAAVAVTAVLMKAEEKSPGAIREGAEELRTDVLYPLASETAAAGGDSIQIMRDEAQKQGLNPGAVFTTPAPAMNQTGDGELAPLEGIPNQAGG